MLRSRIITAVFLIAGFMLTLFYAPQWFWGAFCLLFTLVGAFEWARMIQLSAKQTIFHLLFTLILGVLVVYSFNTSYASLLADYRFSLLVLASAIWLIVVPAYLFLERLFPDQLLVRSAAGIIILIANLIAFLGLHSIAPMLLLAVIATISIADSAAYFGGKQFGRNKLAPTISPGKTWEGVFTALFVVAIYAVLLNMHLQYSNSLIVGLMALVAFSVIGDLFESKLKRHANIKDSGNILPGHGGVLDRIDGIMPATTLTYFYILLML